MFASYAIWHYTSALKSGTLLLQNMTLFMLHFFSVPLLVRTLFAKFGRLGEDYKKGFDPASFFTTLVINTLMRLIGFLVRSIIILIGLISTIITGVLGVILLFAWLLLPPIVFVSFVYGVTLLV